MRVTCADGKSAVGPCALMSVNGGSRGVALLHCLLQDVRARFANGEEVLCHGNPECLIQRNVCADNSRLPLSEAARKLCVSTKEGQPRRDMTELGAPRFLQADEKDRSRSQNHALLVPSTSERYWISN